MRWKVYAMDSILGPAPLATEESPEFHATRSAGYAWRARRLERASIGPRTEVSCAVLLCRRNEVQRAPARAARGLHQSTPVNK